MNRRVNRLLAASIALTIMSFGLVGCERDSDGTPRASSDSTKDTATDQNLKNKEDASQVAGSKLPGDQIGAADLNNIYKSLAETTEAALTKGSFDDMTERFVEADRNRIGNFKDQKFDDLDGRVEAIRKDWKAKYNADFDVDDNVLQNWVTVSKTGDNSSVTTAKAEIPAGHGLPALTVPLVKDNVAWRIDLPDTVNGQGLKDQVLAHVTMVGDTRAQWPADSLEAKRAVVHHVLAGLLGAR